MLTKSPVSIRVWVNPGSTMTTSPLIVAVNGYGAPEHPEADVALTIYLEAIIDFCKFNSVEDAAGEIVIDRQIELHLMGGCTNNPELSEALAMETWFEVRGPPENVVRVVRHEASIDLRGNLESLQSAVRPDAEIVYFCEMSRWYTTHFLARHTLGPRVDVVGIAFDTTSLRWRNRLMQRFPKLWLEKAAVRVGGPCEWLRQYLRRRHIDKHRRAQRHS